MSQKANLLTIRKKNRIEFDSIQEIFHQKKNLEILYYSDLYNKSIKGLKYFTELQCQLSQGIRITFVRN